MPSSRRALAMTVVILVLGLAAEASAVAAPGSQVPAPRSGQWKLTQAFNNTRGGSFSVTSGLKEKGLTTKVGSGSTMGCGNGTVQVLGRHDIHKAGSGADRTYIVGKGLDFSQSWGVDPIPVKVRFQQKTYDGSLGIKFEDARSGEGEVNFNPIAGYNCDLGFYLHRAA